MTKNMRKPSRTTRIAYKAITYNLQFTSVRAVLDPLHTNRPSHREPRIQQHSTTILHLDFRVLTNNQSWNWHTLPALWDEGQTKCFMENRHANHAGSLLNGRVFVFYSPAVTCFPPNFDSSRRLRDAIAHKMTRTLGAFSAKCLHVVRYSAVIQQLKSSQHTLDASVCYGEHFLTSIYKYVMGPFDVVVCPQKSCRPPNHCNSRVCTPSCVNSCFTCLTTTRDRATASMGVRFFQANRCRVIR